MNKHTKPDCCVQQGQSHEKGVKHLPREKNPKTRKQFMARQNLFEGVPARPPPLRVRLKTRNNFSRVVAVHDLCPTSTLKKYSRHSTWASGDYLVFLRKYNDFFVQNAAWGELLPPSWLLRGAGGAAQPGIGSQPAVFFVSPPSMSVPKNSGPGPDNIFPQPSVRLSVSPGPQGCAAPGGWPPGARADREWEEEDPWGTRCWGVLPGLRFLGLWGVSGVSPRVSKAKAARSPNCGKIERHEVFWKGSLQIKRSREFVEHLGPWFVSLRFELFHAPIVWPVCRR